MHELIKSVTADLNESTDTISLTIVDSNDNKDNITAKVSSKGIFRFSYVHPENEKKYSYQGVFDSPESSKFRIFPMYGYGVISTKPIYLE